MAQTQPFTLEQKTQAQAYGMLLNPGIGVELVPAEPTAPLYPDIELSSPLKEQIEFFLSELLAQHNTLAEELRAIDERRRLLSQRSYELACDITAAQALLKRFPDKLPSCEFDAA